MSTMMIATMNLVEHLSQIPFLPTDGFAVLAQDGGWNWDDFWNGVDRGACAAQPWFC